jgi:hypothetical protein
LEIGRLILQAYVEAYRGGHQGPHHTDENGQRRTFKQYRPRKVQTLVGEIEVNRAVYTNPQADPSSIYPLDARLGITGAFSEGLQEVITFTAASATYEETSGLVERILGQTVSPTTVEAMVRQWGRRAAEERDERLPRQPPSERMAVLVDAAKVRTAERLPAGDGSRKQDFEEQWRDVKVGAIHSVNEHGEANRDKRYTASLGGKEAFGERLWQQVVASAADKASLVAWIGDGAEWIWSLKEEMLPDAVEILDFFHAKDHLCHVAKAMWGEHTRQGSRWLDRQVKRLYDGEVKTVIATLQRLARRVGDPPAGCDEADRRRVVAENVRYFKNNASRMDYKRYLEQGLPIGSGVVESACKHVVAQRMKITGSMSWDATTADQLLQLRSLVRGRQWDAFWQLPKLAA